LKEEREGFRDFVEGVFLVFPERREGTEEKKIDCFFFVFV